MNRVKLEENINIPRQKRWEINNLGDIDIEKKKIDKVNIIIPAYNSEKTITKILNCILNEEFAPTTKVHIEIDVNATKDNTAQIANLFLRSKISDNENYTYSINESPIAGEPLSLNRMIHRSYKNINKDRVLITLNDDICFSKGSLIALHLAMINNPTIGAIGIPPYPIQEKYIFESDTFIRKVSSYYQIRGNKQNIIGKMYAFKPDIIGEFADVRAEDNYLVLKTLENENSDGFAILMDERFKAYNNVPNDLKSFIKMLVSYRKATLQFSESFPQWEEYVHLIWPKSEKTLSQKLKCKIEEDKEYSLHYKAASFALVKLGTFLGNLDYNIRKPKGSIRQKN